jgi:Tfp pilus assembly protein PilZ
MKTSKEQVQAPSVIAQLIGLIKKMTEHEREILLHTLKRKHFKEKREKPRKPNPMLLDYTVRDRIHQGFIHDISVGGVFIETGESIPVGQEILAMIPVPNSPKSIKVKGNVVRSTPYGIGVKFRRRSENRKLR